MVAVATNPYLFVAGCARSGTTLLQRMLDHHPLLAVSNDPHFIPFAPGVLEGLDPPVTREIVDWLLGYRTLSRMGLPEQAVRDAAARAATYSELVAGLYDTYARVRGKELAGEKTPRYIRFLPLLSELFPNARIVHLLRDGRDVALSMLEWARPDRGPGRFRLWQEQPVAVCALTWRWHVATGRRDARRIGVPYHEARYEDLVARPEPTLRTVTDFLELPFSGEMLDYHRGRTRTDPGLSTKDAWLPPTGGLRDWRAQMAPGDVELFEAIAGDLLGVLGYERSYESIRAEVEALAQRCRDAWAAELAQRRRKVASHLDPFPALEAG